MHKINLLDIVDVLETYADLYDIFEDNKFVRKELDKVHEELQAIPYVKAIPVKWIEKYMWRVNTDEEEETLRKMIISWEKEND